MKACVIQPWYSFDAKDTDICFSRMCELLDQCDESMDLIVLPEYTDVPAAQPDKEHFHASIRKYNEIILEKAKRAAIRCRAIVFANAACETATGYRNTTYAFNREGTIVGRYFKAHPAPSEVKTAAQGGNELDVGYSYEPAEPYVIEIEGIRFGFMTCYDFYFYESFAQLARYKADVIIGCSHQRTDPHATLEMIHRFLCYHTNAWLVRASVSLGEDSPICGCSTIVSPSGQVMVDMKSRIGLGICEFDPHEKYYKSAGFRGVQKSHYAYIEDGRRPWLYRNGGKAIVPFDDVMPYPRLCAHRGFNTAAPENSMPAFGAAISLGADEIEFDLWETADGVIVSCHDAKLDRVSNGSGFIYEKTYEELKQFDFGVKFGEAFRGLKIVTFEEILQKFAGHAIMNIHIKTIDNDADYPEETLHKIVSLIDKYDCRKHVYFMCGNDHFLALAQRLYPDIHRCCGAGAKPWEIVERGIQYGCCKVQLFKPYFNQQMIDKAHVHGIRCNVFFADDAEEAKRYLDMGIDTILTNDYLKIANATKELIQAKRK
ncbi:MAG: hypothetical protein IKU70_09810 [Clostridia bacterium]|nr:hypothetical protein [Clostridia bacterium]